MEAICKYKLKFYIRDIILSLNSRMCNSTRPNFKRINKILQYKLQGLTPLIIIFQKQTNNALYNHIFITEKHVGNDLYENII